MINRWSIPLGFILLQAVIAPAAGAASGSTQFKEECGACHMAFPPQMLPARSWKAIMRGLGDHFGDDASLDSGPMAQVSRYLHDHAADIGGGRTGRAFMRGIAGNETPMRITDTPIWIRLHNEVRRSAWSDPRVKTRSNCLACHRGGGRGESEENERYENE